MQKFVHAKKGHGQIMMADLGWKSITLPILEEAPQARQNWAALVETYAEQDEIPWLLRPDADDTNGNNCLEALLKNCARHHQLGNGGGRAKIGSRLPSRPPQGRTSLPSSRR
jgi:hypothetical protein